MKILVVSSPTGGHLYPAIEVIKKLIMDSEKIVFVTDKKNRFFEIIKNELDFSEKIFIECIETEKFSRKNPFSFLKLFVVLFFSFIKSFFIFLKYKPNIIFSTGGYTAFPVVVFLKIFNPLIKVVLHEQNCVLSITNKFLKFFSHTICLGFDIKKGKKYIYTGNPLREKFYKFLNKDNIYEELGFEKDYFTLFVFGGSQGAKAINDAILEIIRNNIDKFFNVQIVHITGKNDFDRVKNLYSNININKKILSYSNEIEKFYTISDLVISRAGAMTVAELIHFKKPAILIPLPTAAELHQNWNAEFLKKYGCVEVIYQNKEFLNKLSNSILKFLKNRNLLYNMHLNYYSIPAPKSSIEKVIKKIYMS